MLAPSFVREDGGLLFLESKSHDVGRLDALDIDTGRPLWTYVFPSIRRMASTNRILHDMSAATLPVIDQAWSKVRSHPPRGAFPVPLAALLAERETPGRRFKPAGAVPVVLDPWPLAAQKP
jgi:hypothetical protein